MITVNQAKRGKGMKEVIKELSLKFGLEGMEIKTTISNDDLLEWVLFKTKFESLYFNFPKLTENGLKYCQVIYEFRRNGKKIKMVVTEEMLYVESNIYPLINIETNDSVNLLERNPKELMAAIQKFLRSERSRTYYDGLERYTTLVRELGLELEQIKNLDMSSICIEEGEIKLLHEEKRSFFIEYAWRKCKYIDEDFEISEIPEGNFELILRGSLKEIEEMKLSKLLARAKKRMKNIRLKVKQFNEKNKKDILV